MKTIGIWMYENDNGIIPKQKLINILSKKYKVISEFDMRHCYVKNGEVFTKDGINISNIDLLYHMNADEQSNYQRKILKFLTHSGVKIINDYLSFSLARDKSLTNFILKNNKINVPDSLLINSNNNNLDIYKEWFDNHKSSLLKPLSNHGGKGIVKINSFSEFLDLKGILDSNIDLYYLEEFLEFGENDFRIEVFNGEIIGGYSRKKEHLFKTNVTSGGCMIESSLKNTHIEISKKCAEILGLTCTIVDIVECKGKPYVLEVNPIMGIFVEAGLNEGKKHKLINKIPESFKTDNLKIKSIVKYIDNILT